MTENCYLEIGSSKYILGFWKIEDKLLIKLYNFESTKFNYEEFEQLEEFIQKDGKNVRSFS